MYIQYFQLGKRISKSNEKDNKFLGVVYDWLKNIDIEKLKDLFNGSIRYLHNDAYDLDKNLLVFKDIKGLYIPKYSINGLDIYAVPGLDLYDYLDKVPEGLEYSEGLWGTKNFDKNTNYIMVKNPQNETYSLIPSGGNISDLYDFYIDSPASPHNIGINFIDSIQLNNSINNKLKYYNEHSIPGYIGGDTDHIRNEFWKRDAIMKYEVDKIAKKYGVDPEGLRNRLNYEGIVDAAVNARNAGKDYTGYRLLNLDADKFDNKHLFGLDYGADFIRNGEVTLLGEQWRLTPFTNEHGISTPHALGKTVGDNIGIVAAVLQSKMKKGKEDFPNLELDYPGLDYDILSQIYYNRGDTGGKNYILKRLKGKHDVDYYYKNKK